MSHQVSDSSTWLSFGFGAIAGLALGLLLAPSRRQKLRARMGRGFRKTTDSARALKTKLIEKGQVVLDAAARRIRPAATVSEIREDAEVRQTPRPAGELS